MYRENITVYIALMLVDQWNPWEVRGSYLPYPYSMDRTKGPVDRFGNHNEEMNEEMPYITC